MRLSNWSGSDMSSRRNAALISAGVAVAVAAATGSGAFTYARFSDHFVIKDNRVGADVWQTAPPTECGPISGYKGGVVYGTRGDDVLDLRASNQAEIIMGYGGNDTIYAGNSGDCLVGGDGNDKLFGGNAKDILIGGAGDDYLNGNNGKDELDAGGDVNDVCDGGNGQDTVTNCGSTP